MNFNIWRPDFARAGPVHTHYIIICTGRPPPKRRGGIYDARAEPQAGTTCSGLSRDVRAPSRARASQVEPLRLIAPAAAAQITDGATKTTSAATGTTGVLGKILDALTKFVSRREMDFNSCNTRLPQGGDGNGRQCGGLPGFTSGAPTFRRESPAGR